jgi:hypothetical protein
MPKRRRADRSDNEVETAIFSIPEDRLHTTISSSTTPIPTTTFSPPLPEQVFNVSEWTVENDRISTSNTLFSTMVDSESTPSISFSNSDQDLHIPGAYQNYYDVVDVSDFQPPPEPLQPSQSSNTESTKSSNSKERLFLLFL